MTLKRTLASIAVASFALMGAASPALASASPLEDEPGFSCITDGNHICGPGNGVQAGQYVDGALIAWPHQVVPAWCKDICLGA